MAVTTRSLKRAGRENTPPANTTKRVCKTNSTKPSKTHPQTNSQQGSVKKTRAPVPSKYEKLHGATFPVEIVALPHVLQRIDDLAMRPEEALKKLTKKLNCNVSDALKFAAGKGRHDAVRFLLPEVIGDDGYNLEDRVLSDLESMAVTAAGNGHYQVVGLLLTEILAEREDEHEGEFVYYGYERDIEDNKNSAAWHVLDAAAEAGHVDIVELAAGCATEDEYMPANLFIHLAGAGYLGAVKFLYDNGFCTSESVGEAFASTMTPNYTAVANFLLDTDLVSAAAFGKAFKRAALEGWIDSMEFLFSKGRASPQLVNKVFGKVTKIKVLKLLAKKQPITTKAVVAAFRNATSKGYFGWKTDTEAILRFLRGFMAAVKESYGGDAMAMLLYDESRISAEVIRTAFKTAADTGHTKMVEILFDKPALTQAIKHEAMWRSSSS
ncbi:hypothetical protein PHYSODRAFT_301169 [Phytophthora sojae]|uniref:Uncharacterized protein n=1 Tax=Phytophthora sojae (strain P6497) TaxID=1094619 RepID=G4ZGC1_PHYSP|nr:hypothetical protein PHYSODRAFT_301169 [Phytophthora sojae]EGZ18566.1 hypothetical protein PHYSODRAFT_301169 [Phytophthora sojae]|eukprot:XP_009527624.1 hypothetical protein PHYSODRAFT_301169 [Phytophthora sojae]